MARMKISCETKMPKIRSLIFSLWSLNKSRWWEYCCNGKKKLLLSMASKYHMKNLYKPINQIYGSRKTVQFRYLPRSSKVHKTAQELKEAVGRSTQQAWHGQRHLRWAAHFSAFSLFGDLHKGFLQTCSIYLFTHWSILKIQSITKFHC